MGSIVLGRRNVNRSFERLTLQGRIAALADDCDALSELDALDALEALDALHALMLDEKLLMLELTEARLELIELAAELTLLAPGVPVYGSIGCGLGVPGVTPAGGEVVGAGVEVDGVDGAAGAAGARA